MSRMTNKLVLLAFAGLEAVLSGTAFASYAHPTITTVETKGGLEVFQRPNTRYWFKVGGRVAVDQVWFDPHRVHNPITSFPSGAQIRSAYLTFKGGVGDRWLYKLDLFFDDAPNNPGRSRLGDAWVGYLFCDNLFGAVGQVSVPFGMETWSSFGDMTFMEGSLPSDAFTPSNGLGFYGQWYSDCLTVAGAVYHPGGVGARQTGSVRIDPNVPPALINGIPSGTGPHGSAPGSDRVGIAGRITFSPRHDAIAVYHAGLSAYQENFHSSANGFDYWTELELRSRQSPTLFANIPPNSVKDHRVWGVELAGRLGPLLLQGEGMWAKVFRDSAYPQDDRRNPGGNLNYHGYYITAAYVLTGGSREYDAQSGTFGGVTSIGPCGAWEIAFRQSYVKLVDNPLLVTAPEDYFFYIDYPVNRVSNDVSIRDIVSSAHGTTIGLNWYVNRNIKCMANYVRTTFSGSHVDAFGLRIIARW